MRQPKTFLLLSVIVAILLLAVAYAAINTVSFTVTGNATATGDASNFDVAFTGDYTTGGDGKIIASASNQKATLNLSGLTTKGNSATVCFSIKNSSVDLFALLTTPVISNSNSEYFEVTTYYKGGALNIYGDTVIGPGVDGEIVVTITLLKTPIKDVFTNITINFTAIPEITYS